jgi:nitrogen regulatory protein PII
MKQFTLLWAGLLSRPQTRPQVYCCGKAGDLGAAAGVDACVVREARGYSRQKGYLDRYLGSEYSMAFLPKVEITVFVADDRAEELASRIVKSARTGRIGDGKVFVVPSAWPGPLEF